MTDYLQSDFNIYKAEKIASARDFISRLPGKYVAFAGISGSVSYDPMPEDDIDIFLISRENQLWPLLTYAFLLRRKIGNEAICLSLCMDTRFARDFFSSSLDNLQKQDANHVIPVTGKDYFLEIVGNIENPGQSSSGNRYVSNEAGGLTNHFARIINQALYVLVASFLNVKGLIFNHRMTLKGTSDQCYTVRAGAHHFYLDTRKYAMLRERNRGR